MIEEQQYLAVRQHTKEVLQAAMTEALQAAATTEVIQHQAVHPDSEEAEAITLEVQTLAAATAEEDLPQEQDDRIISTKSL